MTRYTWRTAVLETVLLAVGAAFVFPVYVLISLSLKTREQVAASPLSIPDDPQWGNYVRAWQEADLASAMVTSITITGASVVCTLAVSALAAYPLARSTAKWSKFAFGGFMAGLLLPLQLASIPLYQTFRDMGLLGSPVPMVIIFTGFNIPFSIFLYTLFIRALPVEYEEAALIDGCGPVRAFWKVLFPQLRAVTGTLAVLAGIGIWNDFMTPLLYLSGSGQATVPVAVNTFVGQFGTEWNMISAGLVLSIAPLLAAYFGMQKKIIAGFAGGLKG